MACNDNKKLCTPASVFVGVANPACGQFFNPGNFQAEQLIYDSSFNDIINNFGVPVNYYVNAFNISAADALYGEDPTRPFLGPYELQMYVELNESAPSLSRFGFASDDELTGYLHITTFTTTMSSLVNYSQFGQVVEPKSGDILELTALGCDRPNGRGPKWFEITERVDQDIANLNPLLGHYVYRVKAKRYEHSFEPGLSGERQNQQIFENQYYDTNINIKYDTLFTELSDNITTESLIDITTEAIYLTSFESKSYPFDVDDLSKTKVFDMSINKTDIYGEYY